MYERHRLTVRQVWLRFTAFVTNTVKCATQLQGPEKPSYSRKKILGQRGARLCLRKGPPNPTVRQPGDARSLSFCRFGWLCSDTSFSFHRAHNYGCVYTGKRLPGEVTSLSYGVK